MIQTLLREAVGRDLKQWSNSCGRGPPEKHSLSCSYVSVLHLAEVKLAGGEEGSLGSPRQNAPLCGLHWLRRNPHSGALARPRGGVGL